MALTKYDYSVSQDFTGLVPPYTEPNLRRLTLDIQTSDIKTALDHIDLAGDVCAIWFKATLDQDDEDTLDGVVAAHTGLPLGDSPMPVRSVDTEGLDPDTALNCTEGIDIQVQSGVNPTVKNLIYPFPIDAVAARYVFDNPEWEIGDKFDAFGIAAGDPSVGVVTAPVAQGETVIPVYPTVFQYVRRGLFVKLGSAEKEYRVASVDLSGGTITLMEELAAPLSGGEEIRPRRPFAVNIRVHKGVLYPVGDLTSGSSIMAAGDALRVRYFHKTEPTTGYYMGCDLITYF